MHSSFGGRQFSGKAGFDRGVGFAEVVRDIQIAQVARADRHHMFNPAIGFGYVAQDAADRRHFFAVVVVGHRKRHFGLHRGKAIVADIRQTAIGLRLLQRFTHDTPENGLVFIFGNYIRFQKPFSIGILPKSDNFISFIQFSGTSVSSMFQIKTTGYLFFLDQMASLCHH